MILIDGIFINMGGGKVLLNYLIEEIEKTENDVYYLLDRRMIADVPTIKNSNLIQFIKPSLFERALFYKRYGKIFSSILCFGNIPPNIRLNSKVYTYFHQNMYIDIPKEFSILQKIKIKIKSLIFSFSIRNTDYLIVQSKSMKDNLSKKYKIALDCIKVIPFYPPLKAKEFINRKTNTFIYVSDVSPHKNHLNLINSFCNFYDKHETGQLTLTVDERYTEIFSLIKERNKKGYPIINIGFVDRESLGDLYQENEYLIYPSSMESFGLGIVEAIENGCKVIGSNLEYMYQVCQPSIVFDPHSIDDITKAFEKSLENEIPKTQQIIFNQIERLIKILNDKK